MSRITERLNNGWLKVTRLTAVSERSGKRKQRGSFPLLWHRRAFETKTYTKWHKLFVVWVMSGIFILIIRLCDYPETDNISSGSVRSHVKVPQTTERTSLHCFLCVLTTTNHNNSCLDSQGRWEAQILMGISCCGFCCTLTFNIVIT